MDRPSGAAENRSSRDPSEAVREVSSKNFASQAMVDRQSLGPRARNLALVAVVSPISPNSYLGLRARINKAGIKENRTWHSLSLQGSTSPRHAWMSLLEMSSFPSITPKKI